MVNKELKQTLRKIDKLAKDAQTNEELLNAAKIAVDYGKPIKFNLIIPITFMIISSIIFIVFISMLISGNTNDFSDGAILSILGISLLGFFLSLWNCFSKQSLIDDTSRYIFKKDTLQDNKIKTLGLTKYGFDGFENILKEFQEFERGNHSREMKEAYVVEKASPLSKKGCYLYRFHYVDSYTVMVTTTSTDSNGNTTTTTRPETRYNYYNRCGVLYDFSLFKNIKILYDKEPNNKVEYNSSSISFSEHFKIGANSEMDAAKFLKPKVVEIIQKMNKVVNHLNIEMNNDGLMCISFSNENLFKRKAKYDLSEPELFYKELEGHTSLNNLEQIIKYIEKLEAQLDNNFKKGE